MYPKYLKIIGALIHLFSFVSKRLSAKLTLRIFATPRERKLTARQVSFMEDATTYPFKLNQGTQHYYNWPAQGKSVLLLHGWESNSGRWAPLKNSLADHGYNVYALDAPAHGRSTNKTFTALDYALLINEVMRREKIDFIVGHSVGGMALLFYLASYEVPNYLNKIVLLAPTNRLSVVFDNYADIIGMSKRSYQLLDQYVEEKYQIKVSDFNGVNFAKKVSVPSLLIHDLNDQVLAYSGSQELASALPDNRFVTTEKLGHRLISTKVYQEIIDYLSTP